MSEVKRGPTPKGVLLSAETEAKYNLSDGVDVPYHREYGEW